MNKHKKWLAWLLAGAALLTRAECAEGEAYRIIKSLSPDGECELWVKPERNEGEAAGRVQIRQTKSGKILGGFDWSGFGERLVAPQPPFEVFWRKDCRYFAIKYEVTKGWMTSAIYGESAKAGWVEVKMPSEEYAGAIKKLGGVSELFGKGCDSPVEWHGTGDFVLRFMDRNLCYDRTDAEKEFRVTLRVEDRRGQPLKLAAVKSITQKSSDEAGRDVNAR